MLVNKLKGFFDKFVFPWLAFSLVVLFWMSVSWLLGKLGVPLGACEDVGGPYSVQLECGAE